MTKITKIIFFDEKPEDLKQFVQSTFSKIHEELEEHLDAINENTNEIQANYEPHWLPPAVPGSEGF